MSKIAKRGQARHRARANDYYSKMQRDERESSAVDRAVERRVRHGAQRRQLRRLQEALLRELGGKSKTLTELDELSADLQIERERAYFNLGFEHGVAAALARSRLEPVLGPEAKALAAELRERVVHASIAESQQSLVLLDVLWALIAARTVPPPKMNAE